MGDSFVTNDHIRQIVVTGKQIITANSTDDNLSPAASSDPVRAAIIGSERLSQSQNTETVCRHNVADMTECQSSVVTNYDVIAQLRRRRIPAAIMVDKVAAETTEDAIVAVATINQIGAAIGCRFAGRGDHTAVGQ